MSDEETGTSTDEVTQAGTDTDANPDTKDDTTQGAGLTQSDIDQKVSAGIKAYISNREKTDAKQRENDEKIALVKDGKFEEALKQTQAELDAMRAEIGVSSYRNEANAVLVKLGMSRYGDSLIPATKTIDELLQVVQLIQADIKGGVSDGIRDALNTGAPRVPDNTHTAASKTPDQMTPDEQADWIKSNGLVSRRSRASVLSR